MNYQSLPARSFGVSPNRRHFYARFTPLSTIRARFKWFIRYAFYTFIFSVPFEMADINPGGMLTISKLIGYSVVVLAFMQPALCFKKPPQPVWLFAVYLAICAATGVALIASDTVGPNFHRMLIIKLVSRAQMIGLFWIAYNLFHQEQVIKGSLIALALSTILIVFLQLAGLAGEAEGDGGRVTAFDANPNNVAAVLSLGLIAVFGLAYGREKTDWKSLLLFWTTSAILAVAIVRTGSRGAAVALALSFGVLLFKRGGVGRKLKMGFLGLVGIIVLGVVSYQTPAVRDRWEATLVEGSLAKREEIFPAAWAMFMERPISGWGIFYHMDTLGARIGKPTSVDPHNMYLFLLTEVGLIGSIPFLIGVTMCWRAAWRSRFNIQGITPLMMISFLLMINMKGSYQNTKLFWFLSAYALASAGYSAMRKQPTNHTITAPSRGRNRPRNHAISRTVS